MDLSFNTLSGLRDFSLTEAFNGLKPVERDFLSRYVVLASGKEVITSEDLIRLSGVDDPSLGRDYKGGGEVQYAISQLYSDGIDINFFITQRPYLFFQKSTDEFYFFRNNTCSLDDSGIEEAPDLEVLEVGAGQWRRVEDLTMFAGTMDDNDCPRFDGMIRARDLMVQFNRDESQEEAFRNDISVYHGEETLGPQERGKPFYHEEQTSGFCQLHAANAFMGYQAVRPSDLQSYINIKSAEFNQEGIEGLAQGGEELSFRRGFNIDDGIDMGMIISYLSHLQDNGMLNGDLTGLMVGKIKMNGNDELVFVSDETNEETVVDEAFLAARSRVMLGTYAPIHARAFRKNDDESWSTIDSGSPGQEITENLSAQLRNTLAIQESLRRDELGKFISLPVAFL